MLICQNAQRFAGARFKEERCVHLPNRAEGVAEPSSVVQVPRPIGGVGGVGIRNPASGNVGNERDLRAAQADLADLGLKRGNDRIHES